MATSLHPTKERLLEAAERLFAERGFAGVSIRDISSAAEVNVAAVNYHFQGKENLYLAVLTRRLRPMRERALEAITRVGASGSGSPDLEALIRAFVTTYLHDALVTPDGVISLRLIARQMADPSHGGEVFFRELVAPVHASFARALGRARPGLDQERIGWIIASIVGQVMHFIIRWRRGRGEPERQEGPAPDRATFPALTAALAAPLDVYIQQVVDHVTRFSVGGIEATAQPAPGRTDHEA